MSAFSFRCTASVLPDEKGARFFDELPVILKLDLPRAWGGAALDLKEEAGARAAVVDAVGTGAQEERSLKRIDGAVHGSGACEGSEIVAFERARPAMLSDLRPPDQKKKIASWSRAG